MNSPAENPSDLVKIRTVEKMLALSRSAIYAWMKAGSFPRQVKLSKRSVAWVRGEVQAWVDARINGRVGGGAS